MAIEVSVFYNQNPMAMTFGWNQKDEMRLVDNSTIVIEAEESES